jgi:hypothetical protein
MMGRWVKGRRAIPVLALNGKINRRWTQMDVHIPRLAIIPGRIQKAKGEPSNQSNSLTICVH